MKFNLYPFILLVFLTSCRQNEEGNVLLVQELDEFGDPVVETKINNALILFSEAVGSNYFMVELIGQDTSVLLFSGRRSQHGYDGIYSPDRVHYFILEPRDTNEIEERRLDCFFSLDVSNSSLFSFKEVLFFDVDDFQDNSNRLIINIRGRIIYRKMDYERYKNYRDQREEEAIKKDVELGRIKMKT